MMCTFNVVSKISIAIDRGSFSLIVKGNRLKLVNTCLGMCFCMLPFIGAGQGTDMG